MIIKATVTIHAPLERDWDTFTDLTCWEDWSTVLSNVTAETDRLTKGKKFKFCIRPFDIPVNLEPTVKEVVPLKRIVWVGKKHGISAKHEFTFERQDGAVLLESRETFTGIMMRPLGYIFPKQKLEELSVLMLEEIKKAAESDNSDEMDKKGKIWKKKLKSE
jgi:hypothetical protein